MFFPFPKVSPCGTCIAPAICYYLWFDAAMCIKTTDSLSTIDYTGSTLLYHITKLNIFTVTNKAQNTYLDHQVQLDGIAPFLCA